MKEKVVVFGACLLFVSAYILIPAIFSAEIPTKWPIKSITRQNDPEIFKIGVALFSVVGFVGILLILIDPNVKSHWNQ